jgi:hypothetical protein
LSLSVSGGFSIGGQGGNVPGLTNSTAYQESEDISWVKGTHSFGFGLENIHSHLNVTGRTSSDGVFAFTGVYTGMGLSDFMLGDVNTFTQQGVQHIGLTSDYIGAYAQDTWKVSSQLTLNYGLRGDPFMPFSWVDGQSFYFEQSAFNQGIHSTVYPNAPAGVLYSGDPGVPANGKTDPNQISHFSPRLGLAFDPTGKGRMTIHLAYGLFRDYPDFYESEYVKTSPPFNDTIVTHRARRWVGGGLCQSVDQLSRREPFSEHPFQKRYLPDKCGWVVIPPNLPAVYVNQWNASIQRQIATNWLVSANYIRSEATHLLGAMEGDPAVYLPGASCVLNGITYSPCSSVSNETQRRIRCRSV